MTALLLLVSLVQLAFGDGPVVSSDWKEVSYKGRTRYVVQRDSSGTRLQARAEDQNSALFHRLQSDVRSAQLSWRWRVLRHPAGANTGVRSGDDRAAAVFVLIRRSWLPWRTRGLLYQWAEGTTPGGWSSSPYARDIRVITLEDAPAGEAWRRETRDLRADLLAAFGELPVRIEAIGVLCDADNTGDLSIAEFESIELSWPTQERLSR